MAKHESLHENVIVADECDQSFIISEDNQSMSIFDDQCTEGD